MALVRRSDNRDGMAYEYILQTKKARTSIPKDAVDRLLTRPSVPARLYLSLRRYLRKSNSGVDS